MKIDKFIDELRSDYDEKIIATEEDKLEIYKTGSTSLDVSLGVGGIPRGKFIELYGPEGSGKSTLATEIARNAIVSEGDNVLYIDVENMLDLGYTKELLDGHYSPEHMVIVQPEVGEDAMTIAERAIRSGKFGLIVVDSIAALSSERERMKDLDDETVAETARLMSRFFRRNAPYVRRNNVAVLMINQVRDKIGGYVSGYATPGGWALKHYCSVRIQLYSPSAIKEDGDQIGILTRFTVKKNKVAPPYRGHEIPFIFGKGVDTERDTVEFAKLLGIVNTRGSHYYFDGERIGHGMNNTLEYLEENPDTLDKISEMCYNAVRNGKEEEESEKETNTNDE